jgi:hypothetical protein
VLPGGFWQGLIDTAEPSGINAWQGHGAAPYPLAPHSLVLLGAAGHGIST